MKNAITTSKRIVYSIVAFIFLSIFIWDYENFPVWLTISVFFTTIGLALFAAYVISGGLAGDDDEDEEEEADAETDI